MKFQIKVPKGEIITNFQLYVIGREGDQYASLTTDKEVEFDADKLILPAFSQDLLEIELNRTPTTLWNLEHAYNSASTLLDALNKEESIYNAQRYQGLGSVQGRTFKTETEKTNYLLSSALEDSKAQSLWSYIGRSKQDTMDLKICINAVKSHLFKCKDFYSVHYGNRQSRPNEF